MGNKNFRIFIGCLAGTLLLLFRHGYTFGSGDQSEMLPYTKYLIDNHLYPSDFYIQSLAASVPNERYVFSWFLSLFGNQLSWVVLGLHFLTTMFLILGLYRFVENSMRTEGGRWLAALAPMMLLYGVNLGGNEIYYNTFVPSYVAQVIGLWAFLYAMRGEALPLYVLLMLMTYIHPLIGLQVWLLINLSFLIIRFSQNKDGNLFSFLIFNTLYLATAGFYVYKIKNGFDSNNVNAQEFLDIIAFRAPHHYYPHTFPVRNWFILVLPFYLGWRISSGFVRFSYRWVLVGAVVYIIGVYIFKNPTPLSMQWFATTVWLKTFSMLITLTFVEDLMEKTSFYKKILEPKYLIIKYLVVVSLVSLIFMTPQYRLFKQKFYDFPFFKIDNSEVGISISAKEKTPKDALFLIPSDLSEFRFWSERSSFIDYKATNHRQAVFVEWYKRIQKVYNISLSDRLKGANLTELANQNFQKWREEDLLEMSVNQHITHILTNKNVVLNFPKIAENDKYVVYEILRH